jgi:serine/threonine-protein kinase
MSLTHASRLAVLALSASAALLLARFASAQPQSDASTAEALFTEAKQKMAAGDYASACPKLADSYRIDPGGGTLAALALCHEKIGKTATAWAEFIDVASGAKEQGRADREAFARQHIAALEPALSRLTIHVAPETAQLSDLQVKRDDAVVGPAAWAVASPVDPGDHVIEARAPGKQAWSAHVVVGGNADSKSVTIPLLVDEAKQPDTEAPPETPQPSAEVPEHPQTTHPGSGQRLAGLLLGGAGVAALGVGSFFGIDAISKSNQAQQACPPSSPCLKADAVQTNDDAKSSALVADVVLGVGIAAVGAGAILFFTAPKDRPASPDATSAHALLVIPAVTSSGGGLSIQGRF